MPDTVDIASEIVAEHVASRLERVRARLATGRPGDCEECGHWMPRLVDGQCGFCRDGRLPPENWEPPVRPSSSPTRERTVMPAKTIQLPASATVAIAAVEQRARELSESLGVAAADLIVAGAQTIDAENATATPAMELADIHLDALLAEVSRRFELVGRGSAEAEAANARAAAAEARLARVQAAIAA